MIGDKRFAVTLPLLSGLNLSHTDKNKPLLIKNWQSRISVLSANVSSHPFNIVQTYKVLRQKRYAPLEKA